MLSAERSTTPFDSLRSIFAHFAFAVVAGSLLLTGAEASASGSVRPNPDLQENPNLISTPIVLEPLYGCAQAARVFGFIPGATVQVRVDGWLAGESVGHEDEAEGQWVELDAPLKIGQVVTAIQVFDDVTSSSSTPVVVQAADGAMPLPTSRIEPLPLHECGGAVASRGHVGGSHVRILARPKPGLSLEQIGERNTTIDFSQAQLFRPLQRGELVATDYGFCGDTSTPSVDVDVQPEPAQLPAPVVLDIYESQTTVKVKNIIHGAEVTVWANDDPVGSLFVAYDEFTIPLSREVSPEDDLKATQTLCSTSPPSKERKVLPCSAVPPARIRAPSPGDVFIDVTERIHDARIIVFDASGIEIGDGGGARIQLYRPVISGEELTVLQLVGRCTSPSVYVVAADVNGPCGPPALLANPADGGGFGVGTGDYELPEVGAGGYLIKAVATYRFPADPSDPTRLPSGDERFPLVVFAHGYSKRYSIPGEEGGLSEARCEGPPEYEARSWEGFGYVMDALARHGYISVSVNLSDLDCVDPGGPYLIPERAALIIEHLKLWSQFADPQGVSHPNSPAIFENRIDLGRVGIVGHSRGGEAALKVALGMAEVRAVLSIAPTDREEYALQNVPLLVILPAGDGDNRNGEGSMIYDRTTFTGDAGWKSLFYVYGADHFRFNSRWHDSDGAYCGMPDLLERGEQEDLLRAWTVAFFDRWLGGHGTFEAVFRGDARLEGIRDDVAFASFEYARTILLDDFEDGDVDANTAGGVVSFKGFGERFNEYAFTQGSPAGQTYNSSFYHDTRGLVAAWRDEPGSSLTSEVPEGLALESDFPVFSFRVAQVVSPLNTSHAPMSLDLIIEDRDGGISQAVSTAAFGEIPYPYQVPYRSPCFMQPKTILRTIRVPLECFRDADGNPIERSRISSVEISVRDMSAGVLGFDQMAFSR